MGLTYLYAKAVTRVSLANAVSDVDTGANATNTFPPAVVRAPPPSIAPSRGALRLQGVMVRFAFRC